MGQCLPRVCTEKEVELILQQDAAAQKFVKIFENATKEADKADIRILEVRRVPGSYNLWTDQSFYLLA